MNIYKASIFKDGRWQRLNNLREKLRFFFLHNNKLRYVSSKTLVSKAHRIQLGPSFIQECRRRKRYRRPRKDVCHYRNCSCPCAQTQVPSILQQQTNNIQIVQNGETQPQANAPKTNKEVLANSPAKEPEVLPKSPANKPEVLPNSPAKEPQPSIKNTSEHSDYESDTTSSMTGTSVACKEIIIDLSDVDCVQEFLLKNPSAFPDIKRSEFIKNVNYRKEALYKIHPTVKIGKKDQMVIDEKLRDSSKVKFAAGLGLACKTQTRKPARKASTESEDTGNGSSTGKRPPARKLRRLSTRSLPVAPKNKQNTSSDSSSGGENDLPQRKKTKSARIANKTPPTANTSSDPSSESSGGENDLPQRKKRKSAIISKKAPTSVTILSDSSSSTLESSGSLSVKEQPAKRLSTRNVPMTRKNKRNTSSDSSSGGENDLPRERKPKSPRIANNTRPSVNISSDSSSSTSESSGGENDKPQKRKTKSARIANKTPPTANTSSDPSSSTSESSGGENDMPQKRKPKSARIANKTPPTVNVSSDSSSSTSESDDEGSVQAKRAQRAGRATKKDDSRLETARRGDDTSNDEGSVQAKRAQRSGRATKKDDVRSGTAKHGKDTSANDESSVQAKKAQRPGRATKREDERSGTGRRNGDASGDQGAVQAKRAQRAGRATKRDDSRSETGRRRGDNTSDSDEGSVQAKRAQRSGRATKRDDARSGTAQHGKDTRSSSSSDGSGNEFQTKSTSKKENIKPRRTDEQGKPKSTEPKGGSNEPKKKTTTKEKFQKKLHNSVNGRDYSNLEDHAIVSWVSVGGRDRLVNGNRIWRELAGDYKNITGNARSWHSLRNRYLRYILPSLGLLCLDPSLQTKLRSGAAKGEIKLKRKSSLNRRNSLLHTSPVQSAWNKRPRVLRSQSVTPRPIEKEEKTRQSPSPVPAPVVPKRVSFGSPTYSEVTKAFVEKRQRRSSVYSEVLRETPTETAPEKKVTRSRKLFTNKAN